MCFIFFPDENMESGLSWFFGRKKEIQEGQELNSAAQEEENNDFVFIERKLEGDKQEVEITRDGNLPYSPSPCTNSRVLSCNSSGDNTPVQVLTVNMLHGVPFCLSRTARTLSKLDAPLSEVETFRLRAGELSLDTFTYDFVTERSVIREC